MAVLSAAMLFHMASTNRRRASTSARGGRWCAAASCRAPRYRTSPSAADRRRAAWYAGVSSFPSQGGQRSGGELEALARLAPAGIKAREQRPIAPRMVEFHEVSHLVGHDIVGERRLDVHQP